MTAIARALGLFVALLVVTTPLASAQEEDWRDLKREAKRQRIDGMADLALKKVLAGSDKAEALYDKAYGWAAFDNLKIAFGFSGGGGKGVAVNKGTDGRTYMKMGTVGVGLGLGGKRYQLVFLFQDERTFTSFVERGWQADASAAAVAGQAGANAQTDFINGLALYQITDTGLMAHAEVAGTRYWKNKKLN
jgi:lipid-binding SYLF domain-containing protein